MLEIWIATFNTGKLKEFKQLFSNSGLEVSIHSAKELEFYKAPKETGETFLENAYIKASSLRALIPSPENCWVIGEDSGLEVEGLNGLPGIHSARYAGPNAIDAQNSDKLLKMIGYRCPTRRQARYWCQVVALSPSNERHDIGQECKGVIGTSYKGTGGFGYDPLFIPEGFEKTMAELSPAEKNKISHRGKAFRALREYIAQSPGQN